MYNIQKTELMNNSTQPETIQVQKHLFREVEKRYNVKVEDKILLCIDNQSVFDVNKRYTNRDSIEDVKDSFNVGNIPLLNYSDIYDLTYSGFNSMEHEVNKRFSDSGYFMLLIPIITISRGSSEVSFRMDDQELRYIFYDTELLINGDKENPNKTTGEIEEELQKYYKEQLNMLNELFFD